MKSVTVLFFLALLAGFSGGPAMVSAQSSPDLCRQCACLEDNTCSDTDCGNTVTSDCATTVVRSDCGGPHQITLQLLCGNSEICKVCCAYVRFLAPDGTELVGYHTSCSAGGCSEVIATPSLTMGAQYTLSVCLRSCPNETCAKCDHCTARVIFKRNVDDICAGCS